MPVVMSASKVSATTFAVRAPLFTTGSGTSSVKPGGTMGSGEGAGEGEGEEVGEKEDEGDGEVVAAACTIADGGAAQAEVSNAAETARSRRRRGTTGDGTDHPPVVVPRR